MKLYNTLTRKIEPFEPVKPPHVGLYACGLTVYDYTHLGHLRKYTMDDVLVRTLRYLGYKVKFVQNVTDVGHLASDADTGEDKLEKGAKKYGKTVWEIAREFEEYFFRSMDLMGNVRPNVSCRATEHIQEQLQMVIELEKKGFAYLIEGDGVYFDTAKLSDYGKLAGFDVEKLQAGARVEQVAGKRNLSDFALWKLEHNGENRAMVWASPWAARSFPGWHIECSAMALKHLTNVYDSANQFHSELTQTIDIHTGGIDHIPVHHTNEIAQAEAATGHQPFVKYWIHHNFLRINGEKMSKSLNNFFTIDDILTKGYSPQALRMLFLSTHYRSEMNFTWENLSGAQTAWMKLIKLVQQFRQEHERTVLSEDKLEKINQLREQFFNYLSDDLHTPEAMAVVWEVTKSNIPGPDKYDLLIEFDQVLGLGLAAASTQTVPTNSIPIESLPAEVQTLIAKREAARAAKNWQESDRLRSEIQTLGYSVQDSGLGSIISKLEIKN